MNWLEAMRVRPIYRYIGIGGSVYVFELVVILVATWAGASPLWSVTLSFCLGTLTAFFLQKLITFNDKRLQHRVLLPQLFATTLLVGWNLGFSLVLTKFLQHHMPTVVIRTLALAITTIWNFYVYKTRIFAGVNEEILG